MYKILRNLQTMTTTTTNKQTPNPINEFSSTSGFIDTVGLPQWQVLNLWIQPTANGKYSENISRKFQKAKLEFSACQQLFKQHLHYIYSHLYSIYVVLGFPCGSAGKESACNVRDLGSSPGLGRSPEEGKGYPLQQSDLENSMDCIVHGVVKRQTRLSDFRYNVLSIINKLEMI